jgi:hypothetical protein
VGWSFQIGMQIKVLLMVLASGVVFVLLGLLARAW